MSGNAPDKSGLKIFPLMPPAVLSRLLLDEGICQGAGGKYFAPGAIFLRDFFA
jgi:hypothetical protein